MTLNQMPKVSEELRCPRCRCNKTCSNSGRSNGPSVRTGPPFPRMDAELSKTLGGVHPRVAEQASRAARLM